MSSVLLLSPSFLGVTCPLSFQGCSLKMLLFLHQNLGSENRVLKSLLLKGTWAQLVFPSSASVPGYHPRPEGWGPCGRHHAEGFPCDRGWGGGPGLSNSPAAAVLRALKALCGWTCLSMGLPDE